MVMKFVEGVRGFLIGVDSSAAVKADGKLWLETPKIDGGIKYNQQLSFVHVQTKFGDDGVPLILYIRLHNKRPHLNNRMLHQCAWNTR